MPNTAETIQDRTHPLTFTLNTTLYDLIDVVSGDFAAEDRLLAGVVSHMMATGQLRLTGNRRRLRRLLRDS